MTIRRMAAAIALLWGGTAWAAASNVTGDGEGKHPSVAADDKGGLHVAYEAPGKGASAADVYYTSSTDGGKTWSAAVAVATTPGASEDPAIAVGKDGSVVVVWTDTSSGDGKPDIYAARSADKGKTWTAPVDVSNTPGVSSAPDVKIAPNGDTYVIWLDTSSGTDSPDVYFASSADGGKTFSKPADVSNTPGKSLTPAIALAQSGAIHVTWCDTSSGDASPDVYYSGSTDGGKTWSKAIDVSNSPGVSADSDIAVDAKGRIYITWSDTTEGDKSPDIMVATSSDGGKTFGKAVNVSKTPGTSSDPGIAATGDGRVAAIWVDTSGGSASPDVWMATSTNGGKSFGKAKNVSNSPGVSKEPDVTIANGKVFSVWEEEEGGKTKVKIVAASLP